MFSRPARWIAAALVAAAVLPSSARADKIDPVVPPYDLTAKNSSVTIGGTIFNQADPQPTGTGYIQPFLRIQGQGNARTEAGYNTDGQIEFDTKDKNSPGSGANAWTRDLPLNTLGAVEINGTQYYKFMLDANDSQNGVNGLLTLDDFRLYLGNAKDLTGFNDGFGSNSVKIYDMDAASNTMVTIDTGNGHGSGSGDLNVFVPVSYFQGHDGFDYVYLYTSFGDPFKSNGGFEEWTAQTGQPVNSVPAPPGVVLAGMGFGCLLLGRLRLRRNAQA